MTKNQKIAIGIGAVALAYWLYTKNKANKSAETPATPSEPNSGGSKPPNRSTNQLDNSCSNPNEVPCNLRGANNFPDFSTGV